MLATKGDPVHRPDNGERREYFRPPALCGSAFLQHHAAQHRPIVGFAQFDGYNVLDGFRHWL